jgi:Mn-dependent DtxR family transcriptional regulator
VRRYFEVAAYGNERAIARILGIAPSLAGQALRRLERERTINRGRRIPHVRETISILKSLE